MSTKKLNLESLIDWDTVMAQPRYAGGHEEVMRNIFGKNAEVIAWWSENDYQGTIAIAYRFPNGEVAVMTDYYGSCSGCDSWEDSSDTNARSMITQLVAGAKHFADIDEAKAWLLNIDANEKPWEFPWNAAANLALP